MTEPTSVANEHARDVADVIAERVRAALATRTPLRLRGGGTKDFYGQVVDGEVLDLRAHRGIVAYDPTELYLTARCGTPLATLEATLAERGQMLAFEPPHFGEGATLGGAVAAGLSGPRRASAGALRDFVLGVRVVDGRGRDLVFGGQVMKNVAGYDVSRVMAGALGTLGVVLEVTLKVLPVPAAEATIRLELPESKALEHLNQWGGKPLPVSATAWQGGELTVRLSGAEAAVKAARARLGGVPVDSEEARAFWQGVREHTAPFFASGDTLWRLSLPTVAPPLHLPGAQLIEWGGGLRWWMTHADARAVRQAAVAIGGHATLFRGGDKSVGVFPPLAAPVGRIHERLKAEFDPERILNRGRMYGAL
jgi:glycolate oxidase FAD binding subunit